MIYNLKSSGTETEVELKGRLTYSDYNVFRQIADTLGVQNCVFDLNGLEFIDSAGLGMLLLARDRIEECRGKIILRGAQDQVRKMIELGKFDDLFIVE